MAQQTGRRSFNNKALDVSFRHLLEAANISSPLTADAMTGSLARSSYRTMMARASPHSPSSVRSFRITQVQASYNFRTGFDSRVSIERPSNVPEMARATFSSVTTRFASRGLPLSSTRSSLPR